MIKPFFHFFVASGVVACLTLIGGFSVYVFVCEALVCGSSGLWLFAGHQFRLWAEAVNVQWYPEVSLLIPTCSLALDCAEAHRSKCITIYIHHFTQRKLPENMRKKESDPVCVFETSWGWQMLLVLMVWNNVRNVLAVQQQGESHSICLDVQLWVFKCVRVLVGSRFLNFNSIFTFLPFVLQ